MGNGMANGMADGTTRPGKSGRQKATEALAALEAFLRAHDTAGTTPDLRRGVLNLRSLCKALGVSRSTANQNPAFRQTLDAWCVAKGIRVGTETAQTAPDVGTANQGEVNQPQALQSQNPAPPTDVNDKRTIKRLESDLGKERKRVAELEKRLAESIAQNSHLYTLINQYKARESFLTEKGKGEKR